MAADEKRHSCLFPGEKGWAIEPECRWDGVDSKVSSAMAWTCRGVEVSEDVAAGQFRASSGVGPQLGSRPPGRGTGECTGGVEVHSSEEGTLEGIGGRRGGRSREVEIEVLCWLVRSWTCPDFQVAIVCESFTGRCADFLRRCGRQRGALGK